MTYDLVRGLHIIAVIAWVAGLLMLPRLYAYQVSAEPGGELDTKMTQAARGLRLIILAPAIIIAWALGLHLYASYLVGSWSEGLAAALDRTPTWFWFKLTLVIALSGYHGFLLAEGRRLAAGVRRHSERFWRMIGELPFVIAIIVVLLATLEP